MNGKPGTALELQLEPGDIVSIACTADDGERTAVGVGVVAAEPMGECKILLLAIDDPELIERMGAFIDVPSERRIFRIIARAEEAAPALLQFLTTFPLSFAKIAGARAMLTADRG